MAYNNTRSYRDQDTGRLQVYSQKATNSFRLEEDRGSFDPGEDRVMFEPERYHSFEIQKHERSQGSTESYETKDSGYYSPPHTQRGWNRREPSLPPILSLPSAEYRTRAKPVEEANHDKEDGKSSHEERWSLSPDESSSSSVAENGYESMSERSILGSSRKSLISRLMDEAYSSFFFPLCHHPRQHGGNSMESSSTANTQSPSNAIGFTNNNFSAGRGKRTRKSDEDPEDEEDGKRKRRRSKKPISGDVSLAEGRCFACPFNKFDVSTYSNRNENSRLALRYRSCGPPGWPSIGKMK